MYCPARYGQQDCFASSLGAGLFAKLMQVIEVLVVDEVAQESRMAKAIRK